jgi:hypothetical protein
MSIALSGAAYAEAPNATELNITATGRSRPGSVTKAPAVQHDVRYIAMKGNTDTNGEAPTCWASPGTVWWRGPRGLDTYNMSASLVGVSANAWHHAAAVFIASTRQLTLYIDGVQAAQGVLAARTATGNGLPVEIGRNGSGAATWQGKLDDVRIWNVARTGAQISANYSGELASPPTSLVGTGSSTTALARPPWTRRHAAERDALRRDLVVRRRQRARSSRHTPPVISGVSATAITTAGATIGGPPMKHLTAGRVRHDDGVWIVDHAEHRDGHQPQPSLSGLARTRRTTTA